MLKYKNIPVALKEFSVIRNRDAEAICDLAMYNYLEVRTHDNHKVFFLIVLNRILCMFTCF
jgi:kynurenine 3-monooxygenase